MFRSLAEAAANCTRNISAGIDPVLATEKRRQPLTAWDELCLIEELRKDLQDSDCSKRVSSICALAELGVKAVSAVPDLMEAVEGNDWVVRVAAITALGEIGAAAQMAVPVLIEALQREEVCVSAAIALGRMGPAASEAIDSLTALKRQKIGFDRWCAEEALRLINEN